MKKIIALVTAISFLLGNASFAYDAVHLAPPLMLDDIAQNTSHYKPYGIAVIGLEEALLTLKNFIHGVHDKEVLRKYFGIYEGSKPNPVTSLKEHTIFNPANITICHNQLEHVCESWFMVPVIVEKNSKRDTYWLLFSTLMDGYEGFPVIPPTKEELKSLRNGTLPASFSLKENTHRAAIDRYVRHDQGIDKIISVAHEQGLVSALKVPGTNGKDYESIVGQLLGKLQLEIITPAGFTPFGKREAFIVKVTPAIKKMLEENPDYVLDEESGKMVPITVWAHSSNNATHYFVSEACYDALTGDMVTYDKYMKFQTSLAFKSPLGKLITDIGIPVDVVERIMHEMGAACGMPFTVKNSHKVPSKLDDRLEAYFDGALKKDDIARYTLVDLDTNLETRDYAGGETALPYYRQFDRSGTHIIERASGTPIYPFEGKGVDRLKTNGTYVVGIATAANCAYILELQTGELRNLYDSNGNPAEFLPYEEASRAASGKVFPYHRLINAYLDQGTVVLVFDRKTHDPVSKPSAEKFSDIVAVTYDIKTGREVMRKLHANVFPEEVFEYSFDAPSAVEQPRDPATGKYIEKPGMNPADALKIIMASQELRGGVFTASEYLKVYRSFRRYFKFNAPAKNPKSALQTARRDLQGLVDNGYLKILPKRGEKGALRFEITQKIEKDYPEVSKLSVNAMKRLLRIATSGELWGRLVYHGYFSRDGRNGMARVFPGEIITNDLVRVGVLFKTDMESIRCRIYKVNTNSAWYKIHRFEHSVAKNMLAYELSKRGKRVIEELKRMESISRARRPASSASRIADTSPADHPKTPRISVEVSSALKRIVDSGKLSGKLKEYGYLTRWDLISVFGGEKALSMIDILTEARMLRVQNFDDMGDIVEDGIRLARGDDVHDTFYQFLPSGAREMQERESRIKRPRDASGRYAKMPGKSPADIRKLLEKYSYKLQGGIVTAPNVLALYKMHWKEMNYDEPAEDESSALRTVERDLFEAKDSLLNQGALEELERGDKGVRRFVVSSQYAVASAADAKTEDNVITNLAPKEAARFRAMALCGMVRYLSAYPEADFVRLNFETIGIPQEYVSATVSDLVREDYLEEVDLSLAVRYQPSHKFFATVDSIWGEIVKIGLSNYEMMEEIVGGAIKAYSSANSVRELLKKARAAVPEEYYIAGLNDRLLSKALAESGITSIARMDDKCLNIFSEGITFTEGFGVYLEKLAMAGIRVAVVMSNESERALIEMVNKSLPEERRIAYGESIADIMGNNKAAQTYYYRLESESEVSIQNVINIPLTVEKIMRLLGKIANIVDEARLEMFREAAKLFSQAA